MTFASYRLKNCFENLKRSQHKALIPYVVAGYPSLNSTLAILEAQVSAGADIIELGIPFSDPMADGPIVQRAHEHSLSQGVTLTQVLEAVSTFRSKNNHTPLVLMTYFNPIKQFGYDRFLDVLHQAGGDAIIVVDSPKDECFNMSLQAQKNQIDWIFLLSQTSRPERIDKILKHATGYIYYIGVKGVTGGSLDLPSLLPALSSLRKKTSLPLGVGFGIRNAETACQVAQIADAIVIGTQLLITLSDGPIEKAPERVFHFLSRIRVALDQEQHTGGIL